MEREPEVPLKLVVTGEVKIFDKDGNLKQIVPCESVEIQTVEQTE